MKKYKVNVNGTAYEVEIEEMTGAPTVAAAHVAASAAVLEAMKMETEIMAPQDGKVTSVAVAKGAAVESGALLCTIQ